ncbi:hypothetical protein AVEN_79015-1 [Araneus ventricosus]|uniref:Uncharacterized protein n=1 Tax=Araneus ventricosus TaxID=182803 RepID=A0A4Y2KYK7_ARAVE|nr:hypothetical protein AVEN_79015-1 [Araneus ventricosus]
MDSPNDWQLYSQNMRVVLSEIPQGILSPEPATNSNRYCEQINEITFRNNAYDYCLGSEHLPGISLVSFQNLSLNKWQKDWDSGDTGRAIFNILPKITLTLTSWSRESILFATGHCSFPSYLYRFQLHHSDIYTCGEKEDPLHYATSCHLTLTYHFTKPSAENTQLLWKSVLSNKLSRINMAKLISCLTENENLMKQPTDVTSSSDSDPDFSPSPRPQTHGLRSSRGSIPRTLIRPPTSSKQRTFGTCLKIVFAS